MGNKCCTNAPLKPGKDLHEYDVAAQIRAMTEVDTRH